MMGIIICLASVSGIGTVTLAKYINGNQSGWLQIKPEKFYFTSNSLEKSGTSQSLYNWNPDQNYVFFMDIRNWVDDFRIAQGDISYSVAVTSANLTGITHMVDGSAAGTDDRYLIRGGNAATQKLVITIPGGQTPVNTPELIEVTVKAKPKDGFGYTRTLKGTFELNKGSEACHVQVENHKEYIDLLVGVDRAQQVTVSWPSTCLAPDNTNRWMSEAGTASHSITLEDGSSCRLRFFVTGEIPAGAVFRVQDAGGETQTKPLKQ